MDGKIVEPKVAVPRKTNPKLVMKTKKIFVGGLSAATSLEDVKAYFEQFSKVKDAMLAYDKVTNRHRGFGFVTFDNDDVVDKICEIHFHEINGKMVESKKALPKEPRFGHVAPPNQGGYGYGFQPQYQQQGRFQGYYNRDNAYSRQFNNKFNQYFNNGNGDLDAVVNDMSGLMLTSSSSSPNPSDFPPLSNDNEDCKQGQGQGLIFS